MLPIPTHLENYLSIDKKSKEKKLYAIIICSCGNDNFIAEKSTTEYVSVINIKCNECANQILLFDSRFHGWDGFVVKEFRKKPLGKFQAITYNDEEIFKVRILIYSQGKKDFLEEISDYEKKYNEIDWVNAFSEISIDFFSLKNNKKILSLDFETM